METLIKLKEINDLFGGTDEELREVYLQVYRNNNFFKWYFTEENEPFIILVDDSDEDPFILTITDEDLMLFTIYHNLSFLELSIDLLNKIKQVVSEYCENI